MLSRLDRTVAVTGLFFVLGAASSEAAATPGFGTGKVLASIGAEASYCAGQAGCNGGFPEGIAVVDDRVYVAGPATFGTAGKGPSVVTVLDRASGQLETEIPIAGEDTTQEHALSGVAVDGGDNVYVLSTQLGVIRIERHKVHNHHWHNHHWHPHHGHPHPKFKYTQEVYAPPLPIVTGCVPSPAFPCSIPNEMAFDDDGNLYITDSLQAAIFRVPAGGGEPELWFQSPLLAGSLQAPLPFGANGIKISPDRDYVYVVDTFDPADPSLGHVYRIPLVDAPAQGEIELFHTFAGFAVPDSLVFGESGKLYVSLAGSPAISVLDTDGDEIALIQGPSGSAIPFDGPATMAFDGNKKALLVANHAIFGDPANFAVLRVRVGERGDDQPAPCVD